ncbi:MAG: DUF2157 domain-containing protein [Leptospirales bacterium]|nr:DUF2157 domain-containing protein [Leptospirales bacterium]
MIKNTQFIRQLFKELTEWVDRGIITSSQKAKIELLYTAPEEITVLDETDAPKEQPVLNSTVTLKDNTVPEKKPDIKDNINFARVIIGLAVLSLSVGIIIFYAANWRKMPPVFKLIQIFFVIIALYSGAYYFLQVKRKFSLIGRSLLLLGIISYGTGIMLVAQIYHISSHPTNGVLAWAIGAFAIAALMREKYSAALSILLFAIWDIWEYFYFANPNYFFIIPIVLIGLFSYRMKEYNGITISSVLFAFYSLQLSVFWIDKSVPIDERPFYALQHSVFWIADNSAVSGYVKYMMIAGFIIAGLLMHKFGKELRKKPDLKNAGVVFLITGWMFYVIPFYRLVPFQFQLEGSWSLITWGSAVIIASLLLRDKYGYYFSAFIFFLWSSTALTPAAAYWYAIPVAVLAIIFYIEKDKAGIIISAVSFIYFYYYFTISIIDPLMISVDAKISFYVIMQIPLAAFLITYGKIMVNHDLLKSAGNIFNIFGWFSLLIPFIAISWPMDMHNMHSFINFGVIKNCSIEYIALSAAAIAGLFFLKKRDENIILTAPVVFFSLLVFFLPFSHTATRMITLHLAAIGFIFLLLYYSYLLSEDRSFEKVFAFIFSISLIVIKGFGFIILSYDDEWFKLAYLIGFILLTTVCFLINRLAHKMLLDKERSFPVSILDVICAIAVWLSVYLASFRIDEQRSIFEAQPVVIHMTFIFIALSVILYSVLFKIIKKDRIILYLSLIIFISSGVILLTAGPHIPWVVYSFTFNLLLFIISAVYMYYSSIIKSKRLLNFATIAIVIHILTRYFDLFWDMFSGSLLFIITGIIGLAGGYLLEKKRSGISKTIKTSAEDKSEERI